MERKGSNITNPEAFLSAPTSTTKALLIHIVAPRKFAPEAVVLVDHDDTTNDKVKQKETNPNDNDITTTTTDDGDKINETTRTSNKEDDSNNNNNNNETNNSTTNTVVDNSNHSTSTTSSKNTNAPLKFIQSLISGDNNMDNQDNDDEEEHHHQEYDKQKESDDIVTQENDDPDSSSTAVKDNDDDDKARNSSTSTSDVGNDNTQKTSAGNNNDGDDKKEVVEEKKEQSKDNQGEEKEEEEEKEEIETKKKQSDKEVEQEEEEEEEEVTPEEAAAVIVGDNPHDTEIDVEKLLRIAFQNLLEEYHLLNAPTFTHVYCNTKIETTPNSTRSTPSWVQVQVMVRPSSIDEIFNRLERIGIGSDVGTVSMYKAELCRTASPFALVPHQDEEEEKVEEKEEEKAQQETGTDINKEEGKGSEESKKEEKADKEAGATSVPAVVIPVTKVAAVPVIPSSVASVASTNASIRSKVSMAPGVVESQSANASTHKSASLQNNGSEGGEDFSLKKEQTFNDRAIEAAKAEWMNAATRLRIEQVREQIVEQAAFSFDFISLLSIASILAGVGLITDNTVVIVASMLVSPIMGPVLGMTFGGRIQDWPLVKTSLLNESLALLVAIMIGAVIGLSSAFVNVAESWPTNEMQIRGEATGLYTGIAIAVPSGMGVCLSILGNNTGSLVGVAISASLLPPAVNTGICCAFAVLLKLNAVDEPDSHTAGDFAVIGGISFGLTALNIVCIWISGSLMFVIKEVAPTEQKSNFWKRDIKVARKLNEDVSGRNADPRPVDISLIKQGIETALEKHHHHMASGRHLSEGELSIGGPGGSPRGRRNRTSSSGALFIGPQLPNRPSPAAPTLDRAMALHSQRQPEKQKPNEGIMSIFSSFWGHPQSEDEASDEEAIVAAVDDNVRYVGLENMSALLGFDDEEDYEIDHDAVARQIGHGRYL